MKARESFWRWYAQMEKRYPYPARGGQNRGQSPIQRNTDSYYPLCECGNRRQELGWGESGLFGGPFLPYCPTCELKQQIECAWQLAHRVILERDDEDWLDLLYRSHREAFDSGLLPGYWFELRGLQAQDRGA